MSPGSRVERRARLLVLLGALVAPVKAVVEKKQVTQSELSLARAQLLADWKRFHSEVQDVCRYGDIILQAEHAAIVSVHNGLEALLNRIERRNDASGNSEILNRVIQETTAAILRIPVDDLDTILPAKSPFQAYLYIRSLVVSAQARLDLIDPHLGPAVFHRYLGEVSPTAQLTVVTGPKSIMAGNASTRDERRRDAIISVSELLASERPDSYKLLVAGNLHDRYLRIDDSILQLGGSLKDAAVADPYAITSFEATATHHATIDGLIAQGTEWFGPATRPHRKR